MKSLKSAYTGLAALAVAMGVGRFAFTPILPMMQDDAGLSIAGAGWLASANYLGYLIGALVAIRLPLRNAIAIRVGLVVICASTLAMGLTHQFELWLILRMAAGTASAWVLILVSAWALSHHAPGGILYAGVGTGIALTGLACLILMVSHASSSNAWISLGVICVVIAALLWNTFNAEPPAPQKTSNAAIGPRHGALIACYGAFGFGYVIPATFLPALARKILVEPTLVGWAWPVFGTAALLSTLWAGRFRNQHRVWIGGATIMAAGVATPLLLPGLLGVLIAALLVGGTFMVVTMAGMQEARRLGGARARTLMASMTSSFAVGQIAGPLWIGLGHDMNQTVALASLVLLASAGLLLVDGHRQGSIPS